MGLFDFFKKKQKVERPVKDYVKQGPFYLENYVEDCDSVYSNSYEWEKSIMTATGKSRFKIKYYGKLHHEYSNLIVDTDFAPSLVIAVEPNTGEEILLFDGCSHGYNAIFCDSFSEQQRNNRPATNYFKDKNGDELFNLSVKVFYQCDLEEEVSFYEKGDSIQVDAGRYLTVQEAKKEDDLILYIDDDGLVELRDGRRLSVENVWRDSFDFIQIIASNHSGNFFEIVEHELA